MLSSTYTLSENIVIEHSINFILAFSVWCHYMTQTSVWKSCILDFNLAISSSLDLSFLASWSRSFWFSAYHFNFRLRRSISSLYLSSNCWKEQNVYSCTFKAFSFVFYLESINISVYFPWPNQASNNKTYMCNWIYLLQITCLQFLAKSNHYEYNLICDLSQFLIKNFKRANSHFFKNSEQGEITASYSDILWVRGLVKFVM